LKARNGWPLLLTEGPANLQCEALWMAPLDLGTPLNYMYYGLKASGVEGIDGAGPRGYKQGLNQWIFTLLRKCATSPA
jgi:hypothetical protein